MRASRKKLRYDDMSLNVHFAVKAELREGHEGWMYFYRAWKYATHTIVHAILVGEAPEFNSNNCLFEVDLRGTPVQSIHDIEWQTVYVLRSKGWSPRVLYRIPEERRIVKWPHTVQDCPFGQPKIVALVTIAEQTRGKVPVTISI